VSCVNQVITYNQTLANWTAADPTASYYCDVSTGACFQAQNLQYNWNVLSIILICLAGLLFIIIIAFFVFMGSKTINKMSMM
jgi:hypothetical protein